MADSLLCPDARQWQQLQLGRLSEKTAATLEEHLAGCSTCLEVVRDVAAEDEFLDAFRSHVGLAETAEAEAVRRLVERLKGLGHARPGAPPGRKW